MRDKNITTKASIYSRNLEDYKGSYPIDVELLRFDVVTRVVNKITLFQNRGKEVNFLDIIRIGDWLTFMFEGFKYTACVQDYSTDNNKETIDVEIGISYDAIDYEIDVEDLTLEEELKYPSLKEYYFSNEYKEKKGISGVLLLYAKKHLSYNLNKDILVPNFSISDTTSKIVDYNKLGIDDNTSFSQLARHLENSHNIKTSLELVNKVLGSDATSIHDVPKGMPTRLIQVITSDLVHIPMELDINNLNQVYGDVNISFQNDIPNILELDIYDRDNDVHITSGVYVLCTDGVVRNIDNTTDEQMPDEIIMKGMIVEHDLPTISENEVLSLAIQEIGNNYNNEITFTSNKKGLKMIADDYVLYDFFQMLGRPVLFKLTSNRTVMTRITQLEALSGGDIKVKLGVSRKRQSDKLRKLKGGLK